MNEPIDIALRRLVWAAFGIICTAPIIWIWSTWVARNDARLIQQMERQSYIALCKEENGVAIHVLNSDKIMCASGSGRSLTAPMRHPLRKGDK